MSTTSTRAIAAFAVASLICIAATRSAEAIPPVDTHVIAHPVPGVTFHAASPTASPAVRPIGFDVLVGADTGTPHICSDLRVVIVSQSGTPSSTGLIAGRVLGSKTTAEWSQNLCGVTFDAIPGGVPLKIVPSYAGSGNGANLVFTPQGFSQPTTLAANEARDQTTGDPYRKFQMEVLHRQGGSPGRRQS